MPLLRSMATISGNSPTHSSDDQKRQAASTIPLAARKRGCLHSRSISSVVNPPPMKCWGLMVRRYTLGRYSRNIGLAGAGVGAGPPMSYAWCATHCGLVGEFMNRRLSTPKCAMRRRAASGRPSRSTYSSKSMPLKNMNTAAASSMARRVGRPWAHRPTTSAMPPQVHSGTAQFIAPVPSHLPASPGTM